MTAYEAYRLYQDKRTSVWSKDVSAHATANSLQAYAFEVRALIQLDAHFPKMTQFSMAGDETFVFIPWEGSHVCVCTTFHNLMAALTQGHAELIPIALFDAREWEQVVRETRWAAAISKRDPLYASPLTALRQNITTLQELKCFLETGPHAPPIPPVSSCSIS